MAENEIVHTVELKGPKPEIIVNETKSRRGAPMLQLVFIGGQYPTVLKFGAGKAKMILHSIPEIKKFFDQHGGHLK